MPDADTSVNTGADENPGDRPGDQTAPAATSAASDDDTHPGILLYGMYPMTGPANRAPTVRIALMAEALSRRTRTEEITGGRFARVGKAARWVFTGGPRRVKAVYVETPTTSSMPTDMALLVLMRLLRRPVGIYFRDAYPLYRDVHPRTRRRQVLGDLAWRITTPLLKRVASVRYAPSAGLAAALKLSRPVLLPPGTDPTLPDLGIGDPDVVGAIVQMAPRSGLDTLVAAMKIVRERRPAARLRVLAQSVDAELAAALPDWVEVVSAARSELPGLLKPARVCVLPVPINDYTNLAVAVRLLEYLGFGKPIVATDTTETRAILAASGAGTATPDTAAGLAGGILPILADESVARRMADGARRYACSPTSTWDDRAGTVLATLGLSGSAAVEPSGGKGGR